MEITFLGWVSIGLTIIFVFYKDFRRFLYATVFFSGFTGASVLNIGSFSLQPSYYFFVIYLLYNIFSGNAFEIRIERSLLVFFIYCLISIIFPILYKNSEIIVMNQEGAYSLLKFSSSNIIHIIYLLFVLLFLNSLLNYKNNNIVKNNIIRSYILGFYAVLLVCLYQIIAFKFGLEFDYFFRQGVHGNIQGTRLYGPCDEASMLCCYLIPSMYLVWQNRKYPIDIIAILFAFVIGIITQSSTFLVGSVLFILLIIPQVIKILKLKQDLLFWIACFVGVFVCTLLVINKFDAIYDAISVFIVKLREGNQSGVERFTSMRDMIKVGLHYPLGVGFGSCRSKDLFSTWLCNIGIVGLFIFCYYLLKLIVKCYKHKTLNNFVPFGLVLCLLFVSVPEPYFIFVWFFAFYSTLEINNVQINKLKTSLVQNENLAKEKISL